MARRNPRILKRERGAERRLTKCQKEIEGRIYGRGSRLYDFLLKSFENIMAIFSMSG